MAVPVQLDPAGKDSSANLGSGHSHVRKRLREWELQCDLVADSDWRRVREITRHRRILHS